MAKKVKNTLRQPLDIEIPSKDEKKKSKVLNLGPREVSQDLTEDEFKSSVIQSNLKAGNIVEFSPQEPAKDATKKEANK